MKKLMKFVAFAAVASVAMGTAESARAVTVDIVDYIDSQGHALGERAVTSKLTIDGVKITAYGAAGTSPSTGYGIDNDTDGNAEYAYLDYDKAGLGVCSGGLTGDGIGADACTTASDDNVGVGGSGPESEVLSISFDEDWNVQTLYFRDDGHKVDFYDGITDDPDDLKDLIADGTVKANRIDVSLDGLAWTTYDVINAGSLGSVLDGFGPLENFAAGSVIHLRNHTNSAQDNTDGYPKTQFYLSAILLTDPGEAVVPLPAGLLLMLSGLFGLGFLGRFKSKFA